MCACIVSDGNISIYIVKGMKLNAMHNINYVVRYYSHIKLVSM